MVRATPTAVQVEGSNTWYHLNHCTKVRTKNTDKVKSEGKDEQNECVKISDTDEHPGVGVGRHPSKRAESGDDGQDPTNRRG